MRLVHYNIADGRLKAVTGTVTATVTASDKDYASGAGFDIKYRLKPGRRLLTFFVLFVTLVTREGGY
jgi:hypothetical protein